MARFFTGTVFMVDGFGWRGMNTLLMGGQITAAPNVAVQVPADGSTAAMGYTNQASDAVNIGKGADLCQAMVTDPKYKPPFLFFTMSQGGAVVSEMLRRWYAMPGHLGPVDPSLCSFLLLANPERKYGGATVLGAKVFGSPLTNAYSVPPGIPDGNLYPITDFARQYDPISDWPSKPNPSWKAQLNALGGLLWIHNFYMGVTLTDERNVSYTEGNVKFVLSQSDMDATQKADIETEYIRPPFA